MATRLKDYVEVFDSPEAFLGAVNSRATNKSFKNECGKELCTQDTTRPDWHGTPDYETANTLFQKGDLESLKKIRRAEMNIKRAIGTQVRNLPTKSVAGGAPNAALAIIGMPKCMIGNKRQPRPSKIVNIIYNVSAPWTIDSDTLAIVGAKLAGIICELEKNGYRVNLYTAWCGYDIGRTRTAQQHISAIVKIKAASAPLNILRIAYPLVNTSFLRRHAFRFLETCPVALAKRFTRNYGLQLSASGLAKFMRDKFGRKFEGAIICGAHMGYAKRNIQDFDTSKPFDFDEFKTKYCEVI